ncbi:probable leucine-rich repeat receptor-like protein kinase At1g35710 [Lolium rigidum]|uniref:probable leucine-rich repeat receptor-like protein kinase At1g35710 n=1 Tax=Lolium rigidum TaxID=89674 RepID=UPI001F5D3FB8|nr:probable leucine-rich repeat receptor-like protein kinase At1g35710 [Lolium rigidum]
MKHLHHVGLFLFSCSCLLLCDAVPVRGNIQREAEALVNWKASLAGANKSLRSWSLANSTSLCRWRYISCNSAGHIKELNLDGASLNGTLDKFDFSAFPHLKKLILFENGLHGTIPAGIGNLTRLVQLDIGVNPYLRGIIPRSIFQLKHLVVLRLLDLGLDGTLPEAIGNLTTLEELRLSFVNLTGSIPQTIGMLVKLQVLSLIGNNLTGSIPMEIGNMTELQTIYLRHNNLEGQLPGTISHLVKLQDIILSENQLVGHIFPGIWNSSLLQTVNIANNNFSGMFPPSICVGGALTWIIAGYNGFTGLHHQTFQNCTTLQIVDFTENNIVAELRDCLSEHPGELTTMAFSQNQLHGTLLTDQGEDFFRNRTYLRLIDLSNNALHGGLSNCFWNLPDLEFMDLSSNSFSSVVPFSRTCQDNLKYIILANNHFRGTFPLGLKKCKNLTALDLGGNNFCGAIPSWLSMSLPKLNFLRLSSNIFDGIIPHQILQFRQLQVLDLSKNKLTGPVPDDFTNFTGMAQEQRNIESIYPDQNDYRVQIHIVWKNVDYVYHLMIAAMAGIDLSGNSLSQEIPDGLTTLLGLRYLNLSGNYLSGRIPKGIGNLVLLESLDLSRNQLSGEIPPSFVSLKSMSTLNLSTNELSGRIPMGNQLQTLVDPSIYSNNPGLCGFPLNDCMNSSTPDQNETGHAEDREALWLYCFVAAGFIFGFWLYWGMILFRSEVTKKIYSCMLFFQAKSNV